jgi:hypothetical protein
MDIVQTVKPLQQIEQETTVRYFYNTEYDELNYMKCRYIDKKTGNEVKGCYYSCIDSVKNLWKMGLNGHSHTLYKLPELLQAIKEGVKRIFIVEGEKDTDTLRAQGEIATTSGAWNSWKEEFKEYFRGYTGEVIILPDQDEPDPKRPGEAPNGQKYGEAVFNSLADIVPLVYIVNVTQGKDITDFLQVKTMANLETLITVARLSRTNQMEMEQFSDDFCMSAAEGKPLPPRPEGAREKEPEQKKWEPLEDISFKDFLEKKYEPIKFLVEGILPEGLSILSGSPKIGKTFFALNMALSIATGEKTLGHLSTEKVGVAYIAMDEKDQYIQEKLNCIREFQQRNVIPDNFRFIFEINRLSEGGHEQLLDYIDRHPEIKLIVIDTLGRFRKPAGGKGNAYEVDVESIGQIQDICKKKNVSILLLHHNKKGKSEDYVENLSGSMGISGTVDTILGLERARFEDEGTLKVTPRIGEGKDLSVKFNKDLLCWEILGDAEIYSQSKERREIIDILKKENSPMSNKDLSGLLNKNYNAIKYLTWKMAKENILIKTDKNSFMISPYYYLNKNTNSTNSVNSTNSTNSTNSVNTVRAVSTTILSPNRKNLNDTNENNVTVSTVSTVKGIEQKIKCSNCDKFTAKNRTAFYTCEITGKSIYPMAEHTCINFSPMELSEDFDREEVPF